MSYARIEDLPQLPPEGPFGPRAREKRDLDFKTFADAKRMFEHAKDVAAFANALGGVLLVGADDSTGSLTYPGVSGQSAVDVKNIYEDAARLCSPSPIVDAVPLVLPDGRVLVAVNVDPFVDQIVAAPTSREMAQTQRRPKETPWIFPLRVASKTDHIEPEKLPMYMNRDVRRAYLLLTSIPEEAQREVMVHYHTPIATSGVPWAGVLQIAQQKLRLERVSVEKNSVTFAREGARGSFLCRIPLLDVLDAWESKDGCWDIKVAGTVRMAETAGGRMDYLPLPASRR